MATVQDQSCLLRLRNEAFYRKYGTLLLETNRCLPGCVHTMWKKFNFDLTPDQQKYYQSFDPIPYEDCVTFKSCEPRCLDAFREAGIDYQTAESAKDIVAKQDMIDASIQQSKNTNYLLIGGGIVLSGILIYLSNK